MDVEFIAGLFGVGLFLTFCFSFVACINACSADSTLEKIKYDIWATKREMHTQGSQYADMKELRDQIGALDEQLCTARKEMDEIRKLVEEQDPVTIARAIKAMRVRKDYMGQDDGRG